MSHHYIAVLPFLLLVGACNSAPESSTSQAESATVAGDDGAVAAPDFSSDTDNSNIGAGDARVGSEAPAPNGGSNSNAAGTATGADPAGQTDGRTPPPAS